MQSGTEGFSIDGRRFSAWESLYSVPAYMYFVHVYAASVLPRHAVGRVMLKMGIDRPSERTRALDYR